MNKLSKSTGIWALIWKFLGAPFVYRSFSDLVGLSGKIRQIYVRDHLRIGPNCRILDIGCGPGDFLKSLPPVSYTGFDMNPDYIYAARAKFGTQGEFFHDRVSKKLVGQFQGFDLVMANGLIHHLNDEEAIELFEIAWAALKPGGRFVSLDGVYTDQQSSLARYVVSRDRGRFVRTESEYLKLEREVFSSVKTKIYEGMLRIPYTLIVMEAKK